MEARTTALIGALTLVVGCARQTPIVLNPGKSFEGELDRDDHLRQDFAVQVPAGSLFLRLRVVTSDGDVDLFGGRHRPPKDLDDAPLSSTEEIGVETLVVDRLSDPPIEDGRWWFSVQVGKDDAWSDDEPQGARIAYKLELTVLGTRDDGKLEPGPARRFTLDPASGGFRAFRIDVPEFARALRVDLHGGAADLELYARHGSAVRGVETADAMARHGWGAETLLLTPDSEPALQSGAWYVDVMDAYFDEVGTPFEIRVAFTPEPPPEWSVPPVLAPRDPSRPLSRALCSVLEVFTPSGGGSATLVTPDGLALTNAHVVDRGDRRPLDEVVLAASVDSRLPALESFRGKIVQFDPEIDLALIQIDRGFYGAPLPKDYRFPTVDLSSGRSEIGDPLWIVGYPSLGSAGSRVSIHCAHGVLSGFDRESAGMLLETDAPVTPGSSGGAAIDEQGRLVGVPSASLSDADGFVGLVTPISFLPPEWVEMIRARQR